MITLIKNIAVYAPEFLGVKDVLLADSAIESIEDQIQLGFSKGVSITEIDGTGKILTPGFIDSHQHIIGGGGEGGFATRTPEVTLSDLTSCGITTVVGCIGTDGIAREITSLLAKANALEEEGVSTYVYTGSYQVPVHTLTGSVMKDIMMLQKVVGVGEIAISDHRSSQPTFQEFIRIAADARVAGMLSGKAGVVNVHVGDSPRCLDLLERAMAETEIPPSQFLPTHVNRNRQLFESCVAYAKKGGIVDFTGNEEIDYWETVSDEVRVCDGIRRLLDEGVSADHFTISSDGQGSLPLFNDKQECVGIGIGKPSCILKELRECVTRGKIPLETALRAVTCNPAKILRLPRKGRIQPGWDADLVIMTPELTIDTVLAKGRIMVQSGETVVFGTFEKSK